METTNVPADGRTHERYNIGVIHGGLQMAAHMNAKHEF